MSLNSLKKLTKEELSNKVLEYQNKFNKRNDKRFNNRDYSLFLLMGILLKHMPLISNILKRQERKIFTKLAPFQKQPSEMFCKKVKFCKACGFIKKGLQHRFFPVKFAKFLRRPTLKNICERLLLPFLGFTKLKVGLSPSKKIFYFLQ